jgi:hypothetical protein
MTPSNAKMAKAPWSNCINYEIVLNLTIAQAWDLLWRPEGQHKWLGPDSNIDLRQKSRIIFCDESGPWRAATLLTLKDLVEVTFIVSMAGDWQAEGRTFLRIRFDQNDDAGGVPSCIVTIEERRIPTGYRNAVTRYWQRRKQLLEMLDKDIMKRRENPRQAVVLIHGIGEQQPSEILKNILGNGVLSRSKTTLAHRESKAFIKPDRLSDSFEMRMATLNADIARPTTDVYEVYWAHLIRDTTLNQVLGWLRPLILRWPVKRKKFNKKPYIWRLNVPFALLPLWLLAWITLLATIVTFLGIGLKSAWAGWLVWLLTLPLLLPVAGGLWRFLGNDLALNYLGDAARYLRPYPANIANRQAIRNAGVLLLEKLHNSGKYDRIVMVGHSLGSVIAYDILTHAWVKMHRSHSFPTTRQRASGDGPFQSLRRVEKAAADKLENANEAQMLQHEAWKEMRINTQPWLVTDLVTLGSPLTYAEFLLTDGPESLHKLKINRTLPICPPWLEEVKPFGARRTRNTKSCPRLRFSYEQQYHTSIGRKNYTFSLYHHAAMFAVTRWTNLHVPIAQWGLSGDLISGPLGSDKCLGKWILDIELKPQFMRFMHTWYWDKTKEKEMKNHAASSIDLLSQAMKLDSQIELKKLLKEIPAYSQLS